MESLYDYANFTAALYEEEQYNGVAHLREYLVQQERNEHTEPDNEIDFFIAMVEDVDQLRYRAVELFKKELRHKSKNNRGPLPIPWDQVVEIMFSRDQQNPPARLISYLAENHYSVIENLVGNMRKVLKQQREMTPISRVQKLDSTCLRWFSRQPGIRAEEKAGSRQKILSVVKTESYDTLENRVFKDFLKKCCSSARRYCSAYKQKYADSSRYKAVQKLMHLAFHALKNETISTVRDVHSVPAPNFVLQYDPVYSRIWAWYLQLLAKTRMVEILWPKRHIFTADYFKIVATAYFKKNQGKIGYPVFHSELRLRSLPEKDGLLTDQAFYNNLYRKDMQLTELRDFGKGEIALIRNGSRRIMRCCYGEDGIHLASANVMLTVNRGLPPDEAFANILQQLPC